MAINYQNIKNYNLKYIIKGDQKIPSISAASIVAKVSRDRFITNFQKNLKIMDGTQILVMELKNI